MIKTYHNVDEFIKLKGLDRASQHDEAFTAVVNELGYEACKKILLAYLDINTLAKAYKEDKYLNNIYTQYYNHELDRVTWTWDLIGDDMLHRFNAPVRFRLMSDCNRTCIAKACARMVIEELNK